MKAICAVLFAWVLLAAQTLSLAEAVPIHTGRSCCRPVLPVQCKAVCCAKPVSAESQQADSVPAPSPTVSHLWVFAALRWALPAPPATAGPSANPLLVDSANARVPLYLRQGVLLI